MKKLFIITPIICLSGIFPGSIFAQDLQNQLSRYVTSQLNEDDKTIIEAPLDEKTQDATYEEIKAILQSIRDSGTCTLPEAAQDIADYITENAVFSATGELDEWEQKRSELYRYVQSSNWRTGKNISDADRAFRETLNTIFFGLIKEIAQLCGWDRILDRLEQETINKYENNESIQIAVATVAANISEALDSDDHTLHTLYRDVQNNAFTLLAINSVDFNKLIKEYPEVKFLFEDMYTFFKWRYELRKADASYKLNENNINVEFRLASSTNSFFAFWELANIAKAEMRNASKNKEDKGNKFITLTVSDERDNMALFEIYAKQALYFGRVWNGMQRYAVNKGILPQTLNPKRGARKASIEKAINNSFNNLGNDQILSILDEIRNYYAASRDVSEKYWKEWLTEQKSQQIQENLDQLLQRLERVTDSLKITIEQDTLQVTP